MAQECECGYPARVLTECEAKRRLIDWVTISAHAVDGEWGDSCSVEQLVREECERITDAMRCWTH